ncbi:MAG: hypothetical protein GY679_01615 [Mycoplasma sp.]|nr:hypothetical protein [Mycoplasma sp.]
MKINKDFLNVGQLKELLSNYDNSIPVVVVIAGSGDAHSINKEDTEIIDSVDLGNNEHETYYEYEYGCLRDCEKCIEKCCKEKYLRLTYV